MKVVIPSRYEPKRLEALLRTIAGQVEAILVLDNGHRRTLKVPANVIVEDARGIGIYAMWNRGRQWAASSKVVILNDDVTLEAGLLEALEVALDDPTVGIAYPGEGMVRDAIGPYRMTGFCFAFRGDLPVPEFDEGFEWWCGDTAFEREVLKAGYSVVGVPGSFQHESDSERNGWQRRPELQDAVRRDIARWKSMVIRTVLLVPRRANPERDALWAWCKARWERYFPDIPIYEGHHDEGPFNRSAAINTAARLADEEGRWDFGIVIDADIFLRVSQVRAAIDKAYETGRVTWAHRRWRGIREDLTPKVVADRREFGPEIDHDDMDILVERTNPISWSCCVVIPRMVWDELGGFDERFVGWGFEDMAFQSVVCGLYGWERIEGDVYHLWHSRTTAGSGRAAKLAGGYTAEAITNARLGRRYMVALRRDHQLHDRPGMPSSDEERARDIANLKHDDANLADHVRRLKLPDWSDWWPPLEELRDGWRVQREVIPETSVTVVVHSGGSPEAWAERRGYLEQSLASLVKSVSGPIAQRVIYSDWGPEHADELKALGAAHGFYVAGDGHHGYTESMRRMWLYLAKRAKGEYIFQTEDDFLFVRPVELEPMIDTLRDNPHLAQIALLRDAFYQDEKETGGILGWPEPAFTRIGQNGTSRLEHRLFFTANPSLFRRTLTATRWPVGQHSETLFGKALLRDKRTRFAFWGSGEEWVRHVGVVRAGEGY